MYQFQEIENYISNPTKCSSQSFVEKWLKNSSNYKNAIDENGNENKEYFLQDIELDAYSNAYAVMLFKYVRIDYLYVPQIYKYSEFDSIVKEWIKVFEKENLLEIEMQ